MRRLYWIFGLLVFICVAGIVLSLLQLAGLKPSDGATLFAGGLAAGIVWWQGHLIKKQMELQAIIDLDKEWNSTEMLKKRKEAWNEQNQTEKYRIEGALEFLEKVSTFEKRGVISADLIWETFGWYLWRYYYYAAEAIKELRAEWTPKAPDLTLYENLEALWGEMLKGEIDNRNKKRPEGQPALTERDVREELDTTRARFISSERRISP